MKNKTQQMSINTALPTEPYFKQYLTPRQEIENVLDKLDPVEAIALIESIGKERRKKNSVLISKKK